MTNLRAGLILALVLALASSGCGSSSSTSTAPSTVPRCSVSLPTPSSMCPPQGQGHRCGLDQSRVRVDGELHRLVADDQWSGERARDGTVEYVAAANSDPASRRGVIELNDQRANITRPPPTARCSWRTRPRASLRRVARARSASGRRAGCARGPRVGFELDHDSIGRERYRQRHRGYDVAAATGRTAHRHRARGRPSFRRHAVAELHVFCRAPSYSPAPGGGSTIVNVSTAAGCPWTAASNVPWATVVAGRDGTGRVPRRSWSTATSGPPGQGSVLVAGQLVTDHAGRLAAVSSVDPLSHSFGARRHREPRQSTPRPDARGRRRATCRGSPSPDRRPASEAENLLHRLARYRTARSGTITVAGTQVTVSQSAGCTFALGSQAQQLDAAGGDVSVSVTAAAGCAWTATSGASWITVASGASGTGDGAVKLTVAPTSAARSADGHDRRADVHGQPGRRSGRGCTFSIAPTSRTCRRAAAPGSVDSVTAARAAPGRRRATRRG